MSRAFCPSRAHDGEEDRQRRILLDRFWDKVANNLPFTMEEEIAFYKQAERMMLNPSPSAQADIDAVMSDPAMAASIEKIKSRMPKLVE